MTKEFQYLMHLVACAAKGTALSHPDDTDIKWLEMYAMAQKQAVPYLLSYVVWNRRNTGCPEELQRKWSANMLATLFKTNEKRDNVLSLLMELESAGFQPILLKGYVAAECYAMPDCRVSSDVDILIPAKLEAKACAFLKKKGFDVIPRWTDGHHSVCTHSNYGSIELHVELFDRLIADIWFREMKQDIYDPNNRVRIETSSGYYHTLAYTDNLLFMTLHMVKHFINGGINLRMMLDIVLFIKKHGGHIDFLRYWEILERLSYAEMVNGVLWAMIHYCGFNAEEIPGLREENPSYVKIIMADVEQGRWVDKNTPHDGHENHLIYSAYMQREEKNNYRASVIKQKVSNLFRRIFPARVVLMKYCNGVAENSWLLPVAWIKHVMHGIGVLLHAHYKEEKRQEGYISHDRTAILKMLKMM